MKTDEEILEESAKCGKMYLECVKEAIQKTRESEREKLLENMETWQKNCVVNQQTERIRELEKLLVLEKENVMKEVLAEIKKTGYWKEGTTTYVVEERVFPHDERCEGTMCYCASRTKN